MASSENLEKHGNLTCEPTQSLPKKDEKSMKDEHGNLSC